MSPVQRVLAKTRDHTRFTKEKGMSKGFGWGDKKRGSLGP